MSPELKRVYINENVLCQAIKRISLIFDNFENIIVSISSGKDSTALYWLVLNEAIKRERKIGVFFLDQEAEYSSSITLIEHMMCHENVIPLWYQVPLYMTNATSYNEGMFHAWGENESWIRDKNDIAIKGIVGKYPNRFYSFFQWMEKSHPNTAFFIGIRAEESLNRLRAVIKNPGWDNIRWSTKTKGTNTFRFYPLYDWSVGDIWKYISDNNLPYNSIYDKMYQSNKNFYKTMRVSNLIHEKSFKCLGDLQLYEPETFNKLLGRISGIHVASIYVKEDSVFETIKLPSEFKTWYDFREHLLATSPTDKKQRFLRRFNKQPQEEPMYRKQVRQLLLNDYENNLDVGSVNIDKKKEELMKWWDIL